MKPSAADTGSSDDLPHYQRLDRPLLGSVLPEPERCSVLVVVVKIGPDHAPKSSLKAQDKEHGDEIRSVLEDDDDNGDSQRESEGHLADMDVSPDPTDGKPSSYAAVASNDEGS